MYNLSRFHGTTKYYYNPFFKNFKYTDGIKHIKDNIANWLIVDILSFSTKKRLRKYDFLIWKANPQNSTLIAYDDYKEVFKKEYEWIDLNEEIVIYSIDNILLLPSEY